MQCQPLVMGCAGCECPVRFVAGDDMAGWPAMRCLQPYRALWIHVVSESLSTEHFLALILRRFLLAVFLPCFVRFFLLCFLSTPLLPEGQLPVEVKVVRCLRGFARHSSIWLTGQPPLRLMMSNDSRSTPCAGRKARRSSARLDRVMALIKEKQGQCTSAAGANCMRRVFDVELALFCQPARQHNR